MLRVERAGAIAIWTLDRAVAKNALNSETIESLVGALDDASRQSDLRAVVLTGAGDAFSAGADLREARAIVSTRDAETFSNIGEALCGRIEALPVPVIAALNGATFGGGAELALACDLRVADPDVRIAFKHVRMGVTTSWGALARLVSIVGYGSAARLLLTAQEVGAVDAHAMGLIDGIAQTGESVTQALAWASDVELASPLAVAEMKRLLVASRRAAYDLVRPMEREAFVATWTGPDHTEAVTAYFERRPPSFDPTGATRKVSR